MSNMIVNRIGATHLVGFQPMYDSRSNFGTKQSIIARCRIQAPRTVGRFIRFGFRMMFDTY